MTSTHPYETSSVPNLTVRGDLRVGGTTISERGTTLRRNVVVNTTGAFSPTPEESGTVYVLKAASGAMISLPAPEAGLAYTFIVGSAFANSSWAITATGDIMYGHAATSDVYNTASDGTGTGGTPVDIFAFIHSAEQIGDRVEVICDGTNWFAFGSSGAAAGLVMS